MLLKRRKYKNGYCHQLTHALEASHGIARKKRWRLMHEQDSLAFVLLKAKYCPHCSFMEAMWKSNASFTWKSILEAQSVIEKGSRWRIGCEENVKVWGR